MKKLALRPHALKVYIVLSVAVLVILTATAVGLPALWMNYHYLEQNARSQSVQTMQVFYEAKEQEASRMAILASTRPTLLNLLENKDYAELTPYLARLQAGMENINLIAVCDEGDAVVASTRQPPLSYLCNLQVNPLYVVINQNDAPAVWLLRGRTIANQGDSVGKVVVGTELNSGFLESMREQSGLDHTLLQNDQVVTTSFGERYASKASLALSPLPKANLSYLESFQINQRVYYASRFPLNGTGLAVEVALDVTDIKTDQKQQLFLLTLIIISTVVAAVALGSVITQKINRPLVELSDIAARFGVATLDVPVRVDSQVTEVEQLAQALERSRIGLKQALSSLEQEKRWGELLLESIVEGIMILDKQCRITYFSPGAERITGWSRAEAMHCLVDDLLKPGNNTLTFCSQIPPVGEKHRFSTRMKGEKKGIVSVTHAEMPLEAGPASGDDISSNCPTTVLVFRDISDEEALNHLLGDFMANITHEFRTPLSAMAASIELLMSDADDLTKMELKELLSSLHLGILNLENLIDNLLEGASIETGKFRISPRPTNLHTIILSACGMIEPLLIKYNQPLTIEMPDQLPDVMADSRRITQVVINLLSNASRYGPRNAGIGISARVLEGQVEVAVSDCGPGVPVEYRNDLFSGFLVAKVEDGLMKKGAGLGLSVVKAIVKAHTGQVGFREHAGGGSVFWFSVPVAGKL